MPPNRSGPPAHANRVKYEPSRGDKHNTLQKLVKALPVHSTCEKCTEVIEWKKQYGKYKPLKQPAKCTGCNQKAVHLAYHQLCPECCRARQCCAKCFGAMPPPAPAEAEPPAPKKRAPKAAGAAPAPAPSEAESAAPTSISDDALAEAVQDMAVQQQETGAAPVVEAAS